MDKEWKKGMEETMTYLKDSQESTQSLLKQLLSTLQPLHVASVTEGRPDPDTHSDDPALQSHGSPPFLAEKEQVSLVTSSMHFHTAVPPSSEGMPQNPDLHPRIDAGGCNPSSANNDVPNMSTELGHPEEGLSEFPAGVGFLEIYSGEDSDFQPPPMVGRATRARAVVANALLPPQ
jgi:hypothetical protein